MAKYACRDGTCIQLMERYIRNKMNLCIAVTFLPAWLFCRLYYPSTRKQCTYMCNAAKERNVSEITMYGKWFPIANPDTQKYTYRVHIARHQLVIENVLIKMAASGSCQTKLFIGYERIKHPTHMHPDIVAYLAHSFAGPLLPTTEVLRTKQAQRFSMAKPRIVD